MKGNPVVRKNGIRGIRFRAVVHHRYVNFMRPEFTNQFIKFLKGFFRNAGLISFYLESYYSPPFVHCNRIETAGSSANGMCFA